MLNYSEVQGWVPLWAGDLDLADPRVSPLFGSGGAADRGLLRVVDLISPQVLRLRERALAEGADFAFVLRKGLIHDWGNPSPASSAEAAASAQNLTAGIGCDVSSRRRTNPVAI